MNTDSFSPEHLGTISSEPIDKIDIIPWDQGPITITLKCDEFTSRCPVTTQPDFGTIEISYIPNAHIVETKSLKLYLTRFRDMGVFSERLVKQITQDLFEQLQPKTLTVVGKFKSRGGISIEAEARLP